MFVLFHRRKGGYFSGNWDQMYWTVSDESQWCVAFSIFCIVGYLSLPSTTEFIFAANVQPLKII